MNPSISPRFHASCCAWRTARIWAVAFWVCVGAAETIPAIRTQKRLSDCVCAPDLNGESLAASVILGKLPALPHPAPALKDVSTEGNTLTGLTNLLRSPIHPDKTVH